MTFHMSVTKQEAMFLKSILADHLDDTSKRLYEETQIIASALTRCSPHVLQVSACWRRQVRSTDVPVEKVNNHTLQT